MHHPFTQSSSRQEGLWEQQQQRDLEVSVQVLFALQKPLEKSKADGGGGSRTVESFAYYTDHLKKHKR